MKKLLTILVCLALAFATVACGVKKGEEATASGAAPAKPKDAVAMSGEYVCRYFNMTIASGWQASPEKLGMVNVLPNGKISPGLYFKFEGDGNALGTAEESINTMISGYNGSPMGMTTIDGVEFKTTTYTYSGMTQTMYVAYREGTKITVTIEGEGAKDNRDITAMLGTVQFR
ncbi:MAG: hypothetical protein NTW38_03480 [Candidatus Aminicenantes bacterium]|nr:hypothetical protein [Candidatus Aminicenantes bacterium]